MCMMHFFVALLVGVGCFFLDFDARVCYFYTSVLIMMVGYSLIILFFLEF